MIVWVFLSNRVLKIPRLTQRYTQQIRSTIILIPIFVIIFGSLGASEAQRDLKKESGEYSIVIRDKTEVNNVQVLRSIQAGILLWIPADERVELIPWGHVKGLYKDSVKKNLRSPLCQWLGWACIQ